MFLLNLPSVACLLILASFVQGNHDEAKTKEIADKVHQLLNQLGQDGLIVQDFYDQVFDIIVSNDDKYKDLEKFNQKLSKHSQTANNETEFKNKILVELDALEQIWTQLNDSMSDGKNTDQLLEIIENVMFNVASLLKSMLDSPDWKDRRIRRYDHRPPPPPPPRCWKPCYYNGYKCYCPPPPPPPTPKPYWG